MGYTHSWKSNPAAASYRQGFAELAADTTRLVASARRRGIKVAGGDGSGAPEIGKELIFLNGRGEDACESFVLELEPEEKEQDWLQMPEDWRWEFCKTNQYPYDALVCAILIRADLLLEGAISISSDGSWADWLPGRELYQAVFGEAALCPFAAEKAKSPRARPSALAAG